VSGCFASRSTIGAVAIGGRLGSDDDRAASEFLFAPQINAEGVKIVIEILRVFISRLADFLRRLGHALVPFTSDSC